MHAEKGEWWMGVGESKVHKVREGRINKMGS